MIINNNISSIFANRQVSSADARATRGMQALSSGMRINSGADDASGLAVSEKMRTQIRGLGQAMRNTQDGVSFIQTTEGYLQELTNNLQRIRELSVQGANGIYTDEDRGYLNNEIGQLVDEIDRVSQSAQFNTQFMLTGAFARPTAQQQGQAPGNATDATATQNNGMLMHIGPNMDNNVRVYIRETSAQALGLRDGGGNLLVGTSTAEQANRSIGVIDNALLGVVSQRSELGAYQNRFESMYQSLYVAYENTTASESRIRDANMAQTVSTFVKDQILTQSSISMLAQANLRPQQILGLLQ
ncbi:MAG: flagellin [Brevinema sp.]